MRIETFDHVALWVDDRDTLAEVLTRHVGMHVVDRTDAFTLVGSDARRGKLTLFAAEGGRQPGVLARVALRVTDRDAAAADLPPELGAVRFDQGSIRFTAPEGLELELVERDGEGVDFDIDHVVLRVPDPDRSFRELAELGFTSDNGRLRAGQTQVELERGDPGPRERPLLNHLALRVESAQEHIDEAKRRGLDIVKVVDAENTLAVFVNGPDGVQLEYVEHKAGFSLV